MRNSSHGERRRRGKKIGTGLPELKGEKILQEEEKMELCRREKIKKSWGAKTEISSLPNIRPQREERQIRASRPKASRHFRYA